MRRAAFAWFTTLAVGCTGGTDEPADTGAPNEDPSGPWACVGNQPGIGEVPTPLTTTLKVVNNQNEAIAGAAVRVCAADPCDAPQLEATTDANGEVTVTLTEDGSVFTGYGEIVADGYLPLLIQGNVPVTGRVTETLPVYLTSEADASGLATLLGGAYDATRGHLLVATWDCELSPAPGVSVSVGSADDATLSFYVDGALPDPDSAVTVDGGFVAINVPPGKTSLTATVDADTVATGEIPVRSGWVSNLILVPNR